MRRLLIAALVLESCSGGGPQMVGAQPSWRAASAAAPAAAPATATNTVTFAPAHEPVAAYNEPSPPPPSTPLGDAVVGAVREAARKAKIAEPVVDARLFRACAELAEVVPKEGMIDYSFVEFALQRNGIIEPSPHLLMIWSQIDDPQQVVEDLQARFTDMLTEGGTLRVGVGAAKREADGTGAIVIAIQSTGVSTKPIPRRLARHGTATIDAVVDGRFHDPEVIVGRDDGATYHLTPQAQGKGGFITVFACQSQGQYQVEIAATGAEGATVLANFPVWCGLDPPASITVAAKASAPAPAATTQQAERGLLDAINHDRRAAGLGTLDWDERLAEVARGHSAEMARTHVVAHLSPTTGSAADRLKAAHITTGMVLENVALAYGVTEAHQSLMNSPGHRANLMSPLANRVGMGVVFGDTVSGGREMFITQVFTRTAPKIDRDPAIETVRQKIARVRKIESRPELAAPAQQLADALAAGVPNAEANARVKGKLDALGQTYAQVAFEVAVVDALDSVDADRVRSLVGTQVADKIGIGVAQGRHPELGDNAVWIVLLLAQTRAP